MNTIYAGISHRGTAQSGVVPTIPSGDPVLNSDLFDREIFINKTDKKAWIRVDSTLNEFVFTEDLDDILHNNRSDLQGGTTDEYYHLTNQQYKDITSSQIRVNSGVITSDISSECLAITSPEDCILTHMLVKNLQRSKDLTNVHCSWDGSELFKDLTVLADSTLVIPINTSYILSNRDIKFYATGNEAEGLEVISIFNRFTTIK